MSFSSEIKQKLASEQRKKENNTEAYALGLIGFGAELRADCVRFNTENEYVAQTLEQDLFKYLDISCKSENIHGYRIDVTYDMEKLMFRIADVVDMETEDCVNAFFADDRAKHAFVIGAFMTGGSVSDPNKSYHIEFDTRYKEFADILYEILIYLGAAVRVMVRKGHYIVYAKEYESVALILNVIGATSAVLDLYEIQAEKEMRNDLNRINNFETANVSKVIKASLRQRQAIEKLKRCGILESLPDGLREIAELRLMYPEESLKELGEMTRPKLGKSGVNHRLERLIQIADKL